jgi:uncharacterized protein
MNDKNAKIGSARRIPWVITAGLLVFLAISMAAGVYVAEGTVHPRRRLLSAGDEMQAREMARRHDAALASVSITARDAAVLSAWVIRPREGNGSAAILLHGQSDNRMGVLKHAELLLGHGFSVLLPDARAHGASGGLLATYGLLEADDIHRWFDWLSADEHPNCIFGLGESMGAAQLLQALETEPRFCAVIAESPFASFREIAYDRFGFFAGPWLGRTLMRPMVEAAFAYGRWKYQLDFDQLSPENAVAATKVQVLLIHGQRDSHIPLRHARRIAGRNPAVILWEVPHTEHCGTISTHRQEFEERVTRWFDGHSRAESSDGAISTRTPAPQTIRRVQFAVFLDRTSGRPMWTRAGQFRGRNLGGRIRRRGPFAVVRRFSLGLRGSFARFNTAWSRVSSAL